LFNTPPALVFDAPHSAFRHTAGGQHTAHAFQRLAGSVFDAPLTPFSAQRASLSIHSYTPFGVLKRLSTSKGHRSSTDRSRLSAHHGHRFSTHRSRLSAHCGHRSSKHRARLATCTDSRHGRQRLSAPAVLLFEPHPAFRPGQGPHFEPATSLDAGAISSRPAPDGTGGPDLAAADTLRIDGSHFRAAHARSVGVSACSQRTDTPQGVHQAPCPADHQPLQQGPGKRHTVDDDRGDGPASRSCATPSLAAAPPCRAGQPRQAFAGTQADLGPRFKGRAASGLHIPLHDVVGLQVSLFLLRASQLRVGHRDSAVVNPPEPSRSSRCGP